MEYVAFFVVCTGAFLGGIAFGCYVALFLSDRFRRNAALAYQEGVQKAKAEYREELERGRKQADAYAANPLTAHKEDRQLSFEESLMNLYPQDAEVREQARKEREERKMLDQGPS